MAAMCLSVCLSVCVCVTSWCFIETDERIELGFGTEAFLQLFYTALNGHSGISERVLPSETLSQTPDLCMCVCGPSSVNYLGTCVCMSVLCVRVCAFVPVIFLLDSCMFYVRMFYGPSWSDLNKYYTILKKISPRHIDRQNVLSS